MFGYPEFLDDHEERHALPTGAGLGFAATAGGDLEALGLAVSIGSQALERTRRPDPAKKQNILNDVKREPHYFLAGLVVGAALGVVARIVNGAPLSI